MSDEAPLAEWIVDAASCVASAFDADRVLVFGSHASGRASRRSDLDLFVIADTALPTLQRLERAMRALSHLPCSVDPVVYTPTELQLRSASPFIRHILATGRVAYAKAIA